MSKSAEAFRTISEVATDLDVPKHVLRFWEAKFPQIRPMKRGGGRRYYRPEDMELLRGIRHLLHAEGYTIKGVQKILREQGIDQVKAFAAAEMAKAAQSQGKGRKRAKSAADDNVAPVAAAPKAAGSLPDVVKSAIVELEACRRILTDGKGAPAKDTAGVAAVTTSARAKVARG
jgi:DNA-binding transcriptional MerR regulator